MSDEETIKLNVSLGLSYNASSSRREVIDTGITVEEWEEMSPEEQEKAGDEAYEDWQNNYLDGSWDVAD
ncbi:hypothetical protein AB0F88_39960 [Streptosporangium sp. NPDC023963]|uniref:DUF7167 family protein n=1 Tax=Streptosporangium sp. NPDC023963 TaxID=3155608 RepID=UPI003429DCB9